MPDLAGQHFNSYKLTRYLGDGSFADVYLGEHIYLKKTVAVKVLRMHLSKGDIESFFIEARTIGDLVHPNIVQVLDCGVDHNIPFLVMNYASNGTLRQRHPEHTILSPIIVLPYVRKMASAIQYAHDRKLIHRDIKPHNMLLGPNDELWLSDFGLVLTAHSTLSQVTQNIAGSPGYMAPEQFIGRPRPASDQYALAVVVYEWLCGERPFHGSYSELCNQHNFVPAPSLREKVPTISLAVEEVVLTALAKDLHRRFASVQEFANALEQACMSQPTLLSNSASELPAPSPQQELAPTTIQPIFDAFDTSTPTILSSIGSPPSAQDVIVIALDKSSATEDTYTPGFSNTSTLPARPVEKFREPDTPLPEVPPVEKFREPDTPLPQVPPVEKFREPDTPLPPLSSQVQMSLKPDISRRRVLVGLAGAIVVGSGIALVWKYASFANNATIISTGGSSNHEATSTAIVRPPRHEVTSTPVPVGTPFVTYNQKSGVKAAVWSPDGPLIASGSDDHTVHVWNAFSGTDLPSSPYTGHSSGVITVAWSPDGKLIASSGSDKTVHVWGATTERDIFPDKQHAQPVRSVAWSPDGMYIASGSEDKTVHVWIASTGIERPFSPYTGHIGKVMAVAWSPNGTQIASASLDGTVQVWNPNNGYPIHTFSPPAPLGERAIAWFPHDGKYIVSGGDNNTVYLWDATTWQMISALSGHTGNIQSVAWSPDGQYIASGSFDTTVKIWEFSTRKPIFTYSHHTAPVWSVAWSLDGHYIASASVDGTVQIWKPPTA